MDEQHLLELGEIQVIPNAFTAHPTGALKDSAGKPRMSLVPAELILGTARAFSFGIAKGYAPHNWRKGIPLSEIYDALQRHLTAWNEGENIASDSKLSHLDHAGACIAMLMTTLKNNPELDDRFVKPIASNPHGQQ